MAAVEYRGMGFFVRCEIIDGKYWEIWTHPGRTRMPRHLDGEVLVRAKGGLKRKGIRVIRGELA